MGRFFAAELESRGEETENQTGKLVTFIICQIVIKLYLTKSRKRINIRREIQHTNQMKNVPERKIVRRKLTYGELSYPLDIKCIEPTEGLQ